MYTPLGPPGVPDISRKTLRHTIAQKENIIAVIHKQPN